MRSVFILMFCCLSGWSYGQNFSTVFEKSGGKQTATYFECIEYYRQLSDKYSSLKMVPFDTTDAGYPLHLVLYSKDRLFDPAKAHQQNKVVMLINNGIHPGEPDGIEASMMLMRDLATGKLKAPENVLIACIPIYNIGGALNRNAHSRVNQDGPESYGFRGNAQNLDLNRDFIKADSKNAIAFTKIFQWLHPDIFIDNHVSDGADYQAVMTLLSTQYDKLGQETGRFLREEFEPALFKGMEEKNELMSPYVNVEGSNPENGWDAFYDSPRYSTGYAALFQTIAFMPETHMLKPFALRVKSDYALMQTILENASAFSKEIVEKRKASLEAVSRQKEFALGWKVDSARYDTINFKGYYPSEKISGVTGMKRMFYDHDRPYEKKVKLYNYFIPKSTVQKPAAYVIPHGWWQAIDRLKLNGVKMQQLKKDTVIEVVYYHIDDYKAAPYPFEKHHLNVMVKTSRVVDTIRLLKGDYIIFTGQPVDRYIVETLEPLADDSFFRWNFFDAVLQEKEWYSNYRWEDVAAGYLQSNPELQKKFDEKKQTDDAFAASANAQLNFIYKNSPWYEPAHLRYPVFRIEK